MCDLQMAAGSQLQVSKLLGPGLNLIPQGSKSLARRRQEWAYSQSLPTATIKVSPMPCVPHFPVAAKAPLGPGCPAFQVCECGSTLTSGQALLGCHA